MKDSLLWVEKYRPPSIAECILSDSIKGTLSDLTKDGKVPIYCSLVQQELVKQLLPGQFVI